MSTGIIEKLVVDILCIVNEQVQGQGDSLPSIWLTLFSFTDGCCISTQGLRDQLAGQADAWYLLQCLRHNCYYCFLHRIHIHHEELVWERYEQAVKKYWPYFIVSTCRMQPCSTCVHVVLVFTHWQQNKTMVKPNSFLAYLALVIGFNLILWKIVLWMYRKHFERFLINCPHTTHMFLTYLSHFQCSI